jgi:hypothetical protein
MDALKKLGAGSELLHALTHSFSRAQLYSRWYAEELRQLQYVNVHCDGKIHSLKHVFRVYSMQGSTAPGGTDPPPPPSSSTPANPASRRLTRRAQARPNAEASGSQPALPPPTQVSHPSLSDAYNFAAAQNHPPAQQVLSNPPSRIVNRAYVDLTRASTKVCQHYLCIIT